MALEIRRKKVSELANDPGNVRKHDDRNIEAIMASLQRFGQQIPIVIDSNNVVRVGNGRLEAARRLGWAEIDTVQTDLKGADAIAFAIADNRTAELAGWDLDMLKAQYDAIELEDVNLAKALDVGDLIPVGDLFKPLAKPAAIDRLDKKKMVECPECGHEFVP